MVRITELAAADEGDICQPGSISPSLSFTSACSSFRSFPSSPPSSPCTELPTSPSSVWSSSPVHDHVGAPEIEEMVSKRFYTELFIENCSPGGSPPPDDADKKKSLSRLRKMVSCLASPLIYTPVPESFILNNGTIIEWDKSTGRKSLGVPMTHLWRIDPRCRHRWMLNTYPNSRFQMVCQPYLPRAYMFEIHVYIDPSLLSKQTTYTAYLICRLQSEIRMLADFQQETSVKLKDTECIQELKRYNEGLKPHPIRSGWSEIALGSFYNDKGDSGCIRMRWTTLDPLYWEKGIIFEGLEIRPKKKKRPPRWQIMPSWGRQMARREANYMLVS